MAMMHLLSERSPDGIIAEDRLLHELALLPSKNRVVQRNPLNLGLEAALLETAAGWEQDGCAGGEIREIIGAVDETFLERMILVLMDLAPGYLLLEEGGEDGPYA